MRSRTRALALSLVGGLLGLTLVIGIPGVSPEQQASALCLGTIDPKCAGANTPILIDAGIMAAELHANGGGTGTVDAPQKVTAEVKPKGSKWGLLAELVIGAAASVFGFLGMSSVDDEGTVAAGGITPEGIRSQLLRTDPTYKGSDFKLACDKWQTSVAGFAARTDVCSRLPRQNADWSPAGEHTVISAKRIGVDRVELTVQATGSATATRGVNLQPYCSYIQTPNSVYASPLSVSLAPEKGLATVTPRCDSGSTLRYLVAQQGVNGQPSLMNLVWTELPFVEAPPSPLKGTARVEVQCQARDGSKSVVQATQAYSVSPGADIPLPDVLCPAGTVAVGAGVGITETGTTTEKSIVPRTEEQLLPAQKEFIQAKPECFTAGQAACLLVLYVIGQNGGLQSCGSTAELCPDWAKDPAATERYKCQYGGTEVDLRHCSAYRLPGLGILPNIKPDGSLEEITAPAPSNLQKPQPGSKPQPSKPTTEQEAAACKEQAPSWFESLNPYWVVKSVTCAMKDVFVPRQAEVVKLTTRLNNAWRSATPVKLAESVQTVMNIDVEEGGCRGFGIDMSWIPYANVGTYYFLPACPGDFFHPFALPFKILITIGIAINGFFGISRLSGAVFGYKGLGGD